MKKNFDKINRRSFVTAAAVLTGSGIIFSANKSVATNRSKDTLTISIITDLHHDVVPDGLDRLKAFDKNTKHVKPDAILQMGDFAYPDEKNRQVMDLFKQMHTTRMHVIGNHDTDAGHTKQQCIDNWEMPSAYYAQKIKGIWFIVLDGNEKGSPANKGGYPSYIGPKQLDWLKQKLNEINEPIVIISHQPLAGELAVDNAEEIQEILGGASNKILIAINGHTHVNCILRKKDVTYLHINSASYFWVGGRYAHQTYAEEAVKARPILADICPYKDALFTMMTIDLNTLDIAFSGMSSEWMGQSPAALGYKEMPSLTIGDEIAPKINSREILKIRS